MPRAATRRVLLDYTPAVLAVPVLIGVLSIPAIGQMPNTPVMVFFLAILLVAWRGGRGPGILTTALIALMTAPNTYPAAQLLRYAMFVAGGATISLVVGSLRDARSRAEAASIAKDRFLAALSHELRTPLTPVLATVTALLDEPGTSPEFRPTLELIHRCVGLEARLIDDLLDISRVIHGKFRIQAETTDVHDLVHRTLDLCRGEVAAKGLRPVLGLAASRPHVDADPTRLQQVLWNLVRNATKFTPAGGTVEIRTRNVTTPGAGERLVLDVADTGIGIDPRALPRIFDAFEQGDEARSRQFGGLGLGLAISRAIADAHGGRLSAVSAGRGQGSTFTLELATVVPALAARESEVDGAGPTPPPRRSLRILLVEDDPPSMRVMSRLLRQREHDVTTADSVSSALEAGQSGQFDLLISDIGLPDGTGWDLMIRLRERGEIRGIAVSGYGLDDDLGKSREAGFLEHLTKPVDFPKLEATIQRMASIP